MIWKQLKFVKDGVVFFENMFLDSKWLYNSKHILAKLLSALIPCTGSGQFFSGFYLYFPNLGISSTPTKTQLLSSACFFLKKPIHKVYDILTESMEWVSDKVTSNFASLYSSTTVSLQFQGTSHELHKITTAPLHESNCKIKSKHILSPC